MTPILIQAKGPPHCFGKINLFETSCAFDSDFFGTNKSFLQKKFEIDGNGTKARK